MAGPRFGVEEEFLIVDPSTRLVVPLAAQLLERAVTVLGERVGGEITTAQLELRTDICTSARELWGQLRHGRRVLGECARDIGAAVVASGSPVLAPPGPPPIVPGQRARRGTQTYRGLHDEVCICAIHVHVELPDRDEAVAVSNQLRQYLPLLLALSANSPFWAGRDTGYASWRALTWTRWPVGGPPPHLDSAAHYDRLVTDLLEAGVLVDRGTVFWDVRASQRYPTLEVRVGDIPVTAWEAACYATLVRAMVDRALTEVRGGVPPRRPSAELLRVAYWLAARDGLDGPVLEPVTGRLAGGWALLGELVAAVTPWLSGYGELELVRGWLARLREQGGGAARQRRAYRRRGELAAVVDYLAGQTCAVEDDDDPHVVPAGAATGRGDAGGGHRVRGPDGHPPLGA